MSNTKVGIRHDCCELWSWGGAPLVNRVTHDARKSAHESFDTIWKNGTVSRKEAYRLLANEMQIAGPQCHIKLMSLEMASRVPAATESIRAKLGAAAA